MIDTSHIDPHWPVDPQAQAAEQPPLPLDLEEPYEIGPDGPMVPYIPPLAKPRWVPPPGSPVPDRLTISKSEIATLRRCPRLYYYEYVLNRTPAKGPGIEAEWGTALHRGLETLYEELRTGGGALPMRMHWVLDNALTPADDYAPPTDPYARAALRAMLRAYAAVWGPSDAEQYEVIAVELPFDLPVLTAEGRVSRGRREGARREGRIDALVRERKAKCPTDHGCEAHADNYPRVGDRCQIHGTALVLGRTWIFEHKSTGKHPEDPRWYMGIELELQPSLYFDAARELGHAPAGVIYDVIRRPDFDDPKPPPQRNKDGSERKAPSEVCPICNGQKTIEGDPETNAGRDEIACEACSGTGRVSKQVSYTNPRHREPAAIYEERVYQLAIARPTEFFHRRALTIEPWQIEEAREDVRAAALEIAWRTRSQAWPRVGDRYVCGARGRVCPWLDVCGHQASAEDDRLYPLKRKKESKST